MLIDPFVIVIVSVAVVTVVVAVTVVVILEREPVYEHLYICASACCMTEHRDQLKSQKKRKKKDSRLL